MLFHFCFPRKVIRYDLLISVADLAEPYPRENFSHTNQIKETMKAVILNVLLLMFYASWLNAQVLEPGDGVRINFYNISGEDISGDYYIQKNGMLQLPYVGQISTNDRPVDSLKKEIRSRYDRLYKGVELILLPIFRISVLGEVQNPGVYYVTGVEKLLDVIALAGGETADSDMSEVYVERKDQEFVFDVEKLIQGGNPEKDFYLQSGDRVYVSRKWGTSRNTAMMISAAGLIVAVIALITR